MSMRYEIILKGGAKVSVDIDERTMSDLLSSNAGDELRNVDDKLIYLRCDEIAAVIRQPPGKVQGF